jgi:hypothetical protein
MPQIVALYKEHNPLRKVSAITGIPVSTLWYKLSKQGLIHKQVRVSSIAEDSDLLKGTYLGIWAGDGSRYYNNGYITKIHVHKKDTLLIEFIKMLCEDYSEKKCVCITMAKTITEPHLKYTRALSIIFLRIMRNSHRRRHLLFGLKYDSRTRL